MEPPPIQYVASADGTRIAYGVAGTGLPLVFLPITFSNFSRHWSAGTRRDAFEGLAQRFQLVTYDGRGQGASQRKRARRPDVGASRRRPRGGRLRRLMRRDSCLMASFGHGLTAVRYAVEASRALSLRSCCTTTSSRSFSPFSTMMRLLADNDMEAFLEVVARTGFPR